MMSDRVRQDFRMLQYQVLYDQIESANRQANDSLYSIAICFSFLATVAYYLGWFGDYV